MEFRILPSGVRITLTPMSSYPIRWSAVFGIGGTSPISGRKHDTFGLAYYYLGFSDDFKDVARVITPVRDERGLGTVIQGRGDTVASHHA